MYVYYTYMPFVHVSRWIVGGVILAVLGLSGSMLIPPETNMRIEPQLGAYLIGDTFMVDIVVSSETPVNVFKGEVHFDPAVLRIESIDYNTSIADLWAEQPWYENGAGTLSFIGGTTHRGGFIGTGDLITITFKTLHEGPATINIENVRILKHDGLGTDVAVAQPIDAIFTIGEEELAGQTVLQKSILGPTLQVVTEQPTTDLNGDGKQSLADISIFMLDLASQNSRSDFNGDTKISTADLSIILDAK